MIRISLRIYLLSNLVLLLGFMAVFATNLEDVYIAIIAALFAALLTIPVLPALFLTFWITGSLRGNLVLRWFVFLLLIAICSCIPIFMISFPQLAFNNSLLPFSMPAAFMGVLFQAVPIHSFLIHSHEQENFETI